MKKFSDFKIKPKLKSFVGQKIKIARIFNMEITILDFLIKPSKHKIGSNYIELQLKLGDTLYVLFSGSNILMGMIEQVPKESFPFTTTIINNDGHFEFT